MTTATLGVDYEREGRLVGVALSLWGVLGHGQGDLTLEGEASPRGPFAAIPHSSIGIEP